jgi:glutamate-1-semialdehyde 2,1-aminomutase
MTGSADRALRERAAKVIPAGMYGHQSVRTLPPGTPQFFARAQGAYLWDVDGKQYLDLMCGYGPSLFGYGHEAIDAAYVEQLRQIDVGTGPTAQMVTLAEQMTSMVAHADWAIFCKNGTDATSMALMTARAYRGKRKVLVAQGAYHGAASWCTPMPAGTLPEDREHLIYYQYNDEQSLADAAASAGDDLAGIFASPFKHDVLVNQALPDPGYASRARALCDELDALLIVDDVRAGFRMARDCSWHGMGIEPDLSSWGKAIANGHPLSALLGNDRAREAASTLYVTGSYWFAGAAMAAAVQTLALIRDTDYLERTVALGEQLRSGLAAVAQRFDLPISQTGPVQMPLVMFDQPDGKRDLKLGSEFSAGMMQRGIYFHPYHNMFINAAMTENDIAAVAEAAEATARALRA